MYSHYYSPPIAVVSHPALLPLSPVFFTPSYSRVFFGPTGLIRAAPANMDTVLLACAGQLTSGYTTHKNDTLPLQLLITDSSAGRGKALWVPSYA